MSRKQEASARFGDDLFESTPAEQFCIDALEGLDRGTGWTFDRAQVDTRFSARADLAPHTLSDCLHELEYWDRLYKMRAAVDGVGDPAAESTERERFTFRRLAHTRAKTKDEAIAVFRYLSDSDHMDDTETNDIFFNLIG